MSTNFFFGLLALIAIGTQVDVYLTKRQRRLEREQRAVRRDLLALLTARQEQVLRGGRPYR